MVSLNVSGLLTVLGILAVWVEELQQKTVCPRLSEAAVVDNQQDFQLIKKAATLLQANSRAGLVSFELPQCNVGGFYSAISQKGDCIASCV